MRQCTLALIYIGFQKMILKPFTGLQSPMRFKPPHCKRLQGVADARRRARRRTFVRQVSDNKADAVPCERLDDFGKAERENRINHGSMSDNAVQNLYLEAFKS
jgi:hypothetical protein